MPSDYDAIRRDNVHRRGEEFDDIGRLVAEQLYADRTHFVYELLQNAEDALQRRHETLRTVFGQHDGKPMQIILEPQGFALELTDLSKGEKPEAELDASLRIEARRPFELTRGPLATHQGEILHEAVKKALAGGK